MNILITGGCGFIGINLLDFFQKNTSNQIIVLDNLSIGKSEYLKEFDVEFIEGDIRDLYLVNQIMKKVDAVIHLAADTRVIDSIENPDYNFDVNVTGTYNLLCSARNHEVEKFVMASTGGAIVGNESPPVNEKMVPRPISPYGASKLCGEAYCSAFAGAYGMKTVCLRFSNVYGPRSYHKGSVIAHFFKQILKRVPLIIYGNGEQTRDFIYVDDLSEVIQKALFVKDGGQPYQLGTGVETSIHELVELIKHCVRNSNSFKIKYAPARKGEIIRSFSDISCARTNLGFSPSVTLQEGLERTWAWFQSYKL
jgi:UDP-glucose 4-epimerase